MCEARRGKGTVTGPIFRDLITLGVTSRFGRRIRAWRTGREDNEGLATCADVI